MLKVMEYVLCQCIYPEYCSVHTLPVVRHGGDYDRDYGGYPPLYGYGYGIDPESANVRAGALVPFSSTLVFINIEQPLSNII